MPIPRRFQTGTPNNDVLAGLNQNFDYLDGQERTKIIRNGNVPTVLEGFQSGGFGGADYGFKVAKPGIDVTTATNDQLAFSSAFDTLKVVKTGTITFNFDDTKLLEPQLSTPHGLGYVPATLVYLKDADAVGTYSPLPYMGGWNVVTTGQLSPGSAFFYEVTISTLDIWILDSGNLVNGDPFSFKYYLLQETAS